MDRRAFLAGSAALLAAEAQPAGKVYRIGVLETTSPALNAANLDAFRRGLRDSGMSRGTTSRSSTEWLTAAPNGSRAWLPSWFA